VYNDSHVGFFLQQLVVFANTTFFMEILIVPLKAVFLIGTSGLHINPSNGITLPQTSKIIWH
jgi:hypothetical protein